MNNTTCTYSPCCRFTTPTMDFMNYGLATGTQTLVLNSENSKDETKQDRNRKTETELAD